MSEDLNQIYCRRSLDMNLSQDQRAQNVKFKAYLREAYIVVDTCYNGNKPDLSKMNATEAKLI